MSENERTKGNCLSVVMRDGKAVTVVRCARLDKCRQAIEQIKADKWKCPGFVAERKPPVLGIKHAEEEHNDVQM